MSPFNFAFASVSPKHANSSSECNLNEVSDKVLFRGKEIEFFLGLLFILCLMR